MSRPTSKTAIANLALSHLKIQPVTSIEPPDKDSKGAKVMAKWYEQARRDVLEAHPWDFARKRASVAKNSTAPAFEYDNEFALPNDYIRLVRIGASWDDPINDYEIEDGSILTNEASPLKFVYIQNIESVSKFSPKFITSFSYRLAQFAAYELTGDVNATAAMEAIYDKSLLAAVGVDGQNRPTRRIQNSKLANARKNLGRHSDYKSWGDN